MSEPDLAAIDFPAFFRVDLSGSMAAPSIYNFALTTPRRDRMAALKFLKRAMKRYGRPKAIVTDRFRSYGAALRSLGLWSVRSAVAGSTTGPKTHTSHFDDENERCRGSGPQGPYRNLPPRTPRSTTTSTTTVTSTSATSSNRTALPHSRNGVSLQRESLDRL